MFGFNTSTLTIFLCDSDAYTTIIIKQATDYQSELYTASKTTSYIHTLKHSNRNQTQPYSNIAGSHLCS